MVAINLLVRIDSSISSTFAALTTNEAIAGWFTDTVCDEWVRGADVTWFGETHMTVKDIRSNELLSLHVNSGSGWEDTDIIFTLEQEMDLTIVRFEHAQWQNVTDHFRDCAMSWAYFLESLKLYVETGVGTPEGIAPACETSRPI